MKKKQAIIGGVLAVVLTTAAAAVFFTSPFSKTGLAIRDAEGKTLAVLPLVDRKFDFVFIHSIHLTKVEERYRVTPEGDLHLYELRYQSSGVGMPADAEEGYRLEDGHFILKMDRTIRTIPLFISIVPGHGISTGGIFYPFTAWAKPEDVLYLSARRYLF